MKRILDIFINPLFFLTSLFATPFEVTVSKKYAFRLHRKYNFISVITLLSFLGLTAGVAALIIILSIFNGFKDFTEKQFFNYDPLIRIETPVKDPELGKYLEAKSKILTFTEAMHGKIILKKGGKIEAAWLNAVNPDQTEFLRGMIKSTVAGQFNLKFDGLPQIVIGEGVAENISAIPNDTLALISPDLIEQSVKTASPDAGIKCTISGIFISNYSTYDNSYIYSDINLGSELFFKPGTSKIFYDINLSDISQTDRIASNIKSAFPKYNVLTWHDLHKDLFNIMKLERLAVFIILSVIILMAIFNLLISMTMCVMEKQRDISIIKSMGASDSSVRKIFFLSGSYVGFLASFWGALIGLGFCWGQIRFNWFALDTTKYLIKGIPISIDFSSVLLICIFALLLTLFSTIIPVRYAGRQKIATFLNNF